MENNSVKNLIEDFEREFKDRIMGNNLVKAEIKVFLLQALQKKKEEIKTDLLNIADEGELEDLRREVIKYFNN